MLNEVFDRAWTLTWQRRDTWWIVLWTMVLAVGIAILVGVGVVVASAHVAPGGSPRAILNGVSGGAANSILQQNLGGSSVPGVALPAITPAVGLALAVVLVPALLVVAPFMVAGVYGGLARALRDEGPLSPYAFWREAWRNWGRGYGLVLMALVVLAAAFAAASLLFLVLHLLGPLGVVLAVLGSVAIFLFALLWLYWGAAHLFMGPWPWGRSLGGGLMDAWRFKWASLGTVLVLVLLSSILNAAVTPLDRVMVPLGTVVALVVGAWITLFSGSVQLGFHLYGERHRP